MSQSQIHDNLNHIYNNLDPSKNISRPIMTKYEYSLVRGLRLQQLHENMMPYVNLDDPNLKESDKTITKIFEMEFAAKKIPFIISRPVGMNMEYWRICDLEYNELVPNFLNQEKVR